MTFTQTTTRWTAGIAATASALAVALPGSHPTPRTPIRPASVITTHPVTTSRATRLHEFRQTIIGLYRVPGAQRPGEDPLDALWRSLATQYGPGRLVPRPGPGPDTEA
jgi:hypothetical protein